MTIGFKMTEMMKRFLCKTCELIVLKASKFAAICAVSYRCKCSFFICHWAVQFNMPHFLLSLPYVKLWHHGSSQISRYFKFALLIVDDEYFKHANLSVMLQRAKRFRYRLYADSLAYTVISKPVTHCYIPNLDWVTSFTDSYSLTCFVH